MAVLTVFRDVAPEFAAESDAKVNRFIDYATPQVSSCYFGDDYELAVAYLSAHLLSTAGKAAIGSTGLPSSKAAGDLSISYAMPNKLDYYSLSMYGENFKMLRDKHVTAILVCNAPATSCGIL